jgi:uncharacterized protein
MNALCIYHGNCADGFTSAWVVRAKFAEIGEDVEFHAGVYQNAPPDVTGRDVLLVDFSYKLAVMREIRAKARSVLVIDHHKTAIDDLQPIAIPVPDYRIQEWLDCDPVPEAVGAVFDLERSGAGLTWDFMFPTTKRPKLVDHVEDRDLWRFKLPFTREIQAAVFSYPYEFEIWDRLADSFDQFGNSSLVTEGQAIERKHHKDIAELTKVVARPMKLRAPWLDGPAPADLGFAVVPMANLPYTLTSDAGHLLCGDTYPFAGCYWDTPEGRVFSLRSRDNGADVGEIAKQYGGGGHKHASGFRVPFDQLGQFEP